MLLTDVETLVQNECFSGKFCNLFYELQNTLKFKQHLISMGIALRAFIEILTAAYLKKYSINSDGSLAACIQAAIQHMNRTQQMPETTRAFVLKLSDESEYFSINTLHKVIHNDFQISDHDLRAFVNNLDAFIRRAIADVNLSS